MTYQIKLISGREALEMLETEGEFDEEALVEDGDGFIETATFDTLDEAEAFIKGFLYARDFDEGEIGFHRTYEVPK